MTGPGAGDRQSRCAGAELWRIDPSERHVYTIKGRLDRQQFGLRWNQDLDVGGVVVGDAIEIDAHVETVRSPVDLRPDPGVPPAADQTAQG